MKYLLMSAVLGTALLAAPAMAQYQAPGKSGPGTGPTMDQGQGQNPGTPGMMNQGAGGSGSSSVNQADQTFLRAAIADGAAEVQLGTLASQKASAPAVKQYGQRMVQDHTKFNERLSAWARQQNITVSNASSDREHAALRDRLMRLSGAEFDRAYIQAQIQDHQKAVQLFQTQSNSGQNQELRAVAAEALPILQQHLALARTVENQLTSTSETPPTSPGTIPERP